MKFNQTFSILFRLNYSKKNRKGLVPIWARITIDGQRSEFSLQRQIQPEQWDLESGKAFPDTEEGQALNTYLTFVYAEITKHYTILLVNSEYVTGEDVKKSYQGVKEIKRSFLEIFRQYINFQLAKKESGELSEGRFKRFEITYGKCKNFISYRYKRSDILLDEVKLHFLVELQHYLNAVKGIGHNTSMKHSKDVKQFMKYVVTMEYLPVNPFQNFRCTYKKVKRQFLTEEELQLMYHKKMSIERLEEVRDCYLFSCYTGYAYSDAEALSPDDITTGIDGNKWIIRDRKKTDTTENVPLLPIAFEIIEKYKKHPYGLYWQS